MHKCIIYLNFFFFKLKINFFKDPSLGGLFDSSQKPLAILHLFDQIHMLFVHIIKQILKHITKCNDKLTFDCIVLNSHVFCSYY